MLLKHRQDSHHGKYEPPSKRLLRRILLRIAPLLILAAVLLWLIPTLYRAGNTHTDQPVQTATICAVGDISMTEDVLQAARQGDGSYDFTSCFLQVSPLLSAADLTIGNLELSFSGEPYGEAAAPASLADTLQVMGFDLLQTANSKSIAGGLSGLRSTLDTLHERGIDSLGTYATQEDRSNGSALLKEVNGIRIAFLGFTKGFDGMSLPEGCDYCADVLYTDYDTIYSELAETAIVQAVKDARALKPDIIIAMLHWGSENMLEMSDSQESIAALMFSSGVDVILGSHSHLVGQMEYRTVDRDKEGETQVFLASSLGNFLGFSGDPGTAESVVLNLTLEKDPGTGTTSVAEVSYVPIYLTTSDSSSAGQCLDIYQSMDLYHSAYLDRVDDETYEQLQTAIDTLKTHTNSEFDRGPLEAAD